jgi:hypothetical protein
MVRQAMCAMLPGGGGLPGLAPERAAAFVAQLRRESSFLFWLGIVGGAFVFTVTPLMTVFVPLPSFLLPARLLDRHAQGIATTRVYVFRQAVFLLKTAAGMAWGMDPEIRARFALAPYEGDPGTWRA